MNSKELKRTLKKLSWVALLFVVAAVVISAIERKETSQVKEVRIEIEPLKDSTWMIRNSDIILTIERSFGYALESLPIVSVEVERLERVLENDPFILNADVYVDAGNRVNIEVIQREPILRIIDNNQLNYYLDREGKKMPLSNNFTARVLVATGNIPPFVPDFLDREKHVLKDLYFITKTILEDEFMNALVEQIYVSNKGEYSVVPKIGTHTIILGSFNHLEDKIKRLKIFYKEAIPYEGWRKYKTVDLRYEGQVVCNKR